MTLPRVPSTGSPHAVPNRLVRAWSRIRALLGVALMLTAGTAGAQQEVLQKARRDLEAGDAKSAYVRLAPSQFERAGDPEYDYLLGLAALGDGRPTEAIFALERVVAQRPDDARVRTAIGRAHLALRETEAARREFQTVHSQALTEDSKRTIERYLSAVDQIEAAAKFATRLFLEFTAGYDSNVNSATDQTQVALPGLGGLNFTLASSSRAQSDGFISLGGGLQFRSRLSASNSLFGGIALSSRLHFSETTYEPSYFDGFLGISRTRGANTFSAALQLNHFYVNDPTYSAEYRETLGTTVQWLRNLENRAQTSLYVQFVALSHPDQKPRDAYRSVLGGAYARGFDSGASVYTGAYLGVEKERDARYSFTGHRPIGVRVGGDWPLRTRWNLFANASAEHRRYRGMDTLFLITRKDRQYSSSAGVQYDLGKGWRVSPQVSYTKVQSNISVNEYDRLLAQVILRGEF